MSTSSALRVLLLVPISLGVTIASAKADFVIKSNPSAPAAVPAAATAPIAMPPIVDPGDPGYQPTTGASQPQDNPTTIHWKMAYGFGNQVPLSFACKQIVPQAVKVTYGPGANPQMIVSWKGGDTWNHVLRNAVAPLGLQLVMSHMAVEIRK